MTSYYVAAKGCDDYTSVLLELTDTEHAAVTRVVEAITAAGGGCKPTMELRAPQPSDEEDGAVPS